MTNDEYIVLVYKNLKGELSSEEFDLLNKTTAENSQWAQSRMDIEDAWDLSGEVETMVSESQTNDLFDRIVGGAEQTKIEDVVSETKVQPAKLFTLRRVISSIAALLVLALGAMFLFQNDVYTFEKPGVYTLADNSTVNLRKGTLTVYKFGESQRKVELRGEAFFNIAKEADRPFVVNGKHIKVQVLGTAFLVKESNDDTYIDLTEGKISTLDTRSLDTEILTAGMKAHHTDQGKINIISEYNNLSSWRDGFYQYKNTKLGSVVDELSIIFDTNISIADPNLSECSFSGNISGDQLEDILSPIGKKYKMEILQKESEWILTNGTCD